MWEDFKAFAVKGNVVDLAIGFIMGGAFGKIVSSAVSDLMMPPIGKLMGGVDFSSLFFDLSGKGYTTVEAAIKEGAPVMKYGLFLNHCIDFLIVALCCFGVIRLLSKLKKPVPTAVPTTKDCPECFSVIPIQAKKCGHCTSVVLKALFFAVMFAANLLHAAEAQEGPGKLSHESEASVVITTGNTTTQTYSVKQETKYKWEQNGVKFSGSYLYGKSDGVDKAKKWDLGLRYDRELSAKFGAFLGYTLDSDIFAGFDLRHTIDVGGKYQLYKTEETDLRSEAGYQFQSERQATSQLNTTYNLARVYLAWEQKWNSSVSSKLWGEYLQNLKTGTDYRFNFEPSLSILLTNVFSLKLAYLFNYRNLPAAAGKKTLDTVYTTSLVAKF